MAVPYIPGAMVTAVRNRYPLVEDEYHNEVRDTSAAPLVQPIEDCCFQPKVGSEFMQDTDRFTVRGDLYLPLEANVLSTDTFTVPGYGEFEVDGPLMRWPDVANLGHVQAALVWYRDAVTGGPEGVLDPSSLYGVTELAEELEEHIVNPVPHVPALSEKDYAPWLDALTPELEE